MKQIIEVFELNTEQILKVEFDSCGLVKNMLQTCYAFPEDYPKVDFEIAEKKFEAWFVGYKSTGNRVFMLKNGTCVTENLKRIRDLDSIIWRLKLERD